MKTCYVRTFGCQMNVHDSARILELMERAGYQSAVSPEEADVLIVNTCTVREKAWHKGISEAGRMRVLKKKRPSRILVVVGCVAEQERSRLFELIPGIDIVAGPEHYRALPSLIEEIENAANPVARTGFAAGQRTEFLSARPTPIPCRPTQFLTIMKGCDERCAYCIVPRVRGPERFRPMLEIVAEAEELVHRGTREITLLGQKVNSYLHKGADFTELLERLDEIPQLARLRFTSPHPRFMTDRLISSFGRLRTLCEAIHLPLQSGSDPVLERMRRRYTSGFYRGVAAALGEACPSIMISTDLIVGYPGETEDDFAKTIGLLEDVRFSGAFSFKYSPRPGTAAAQLADDVTPEQKATRLEAVHQVVGRMEKQARQELVGQTLEVLVDGTGRNPGQISGRARNGQIVNFMPEKNDRLKSPDRELVGVRITRALPHSLEGSPAKGNAL